MKKIFTLMGSIAIACTLSANAEVITLYPCDSDGNALAEASESELTLDEDGNYVISDFLNSEAPVVFNFEKPEPDKTANITFYGSLDREDEYPYLMTPDGKYMTCWLWGYKDAEDWTPIYWPYVAEDGYSYVYRYDMTLPETQDYKYEYYGCICLSGFNEDNSYFEWVYVNFYFNEPDPNGVAEIAGAADNKVEFFDLNGRRVDNPSSGIFIRRQGDKTSKVLLR